MRAHISEEISSVLEVRFSEAWSSSIFGFSYDGAEKSNSLSTSSLALYRYVSSRLIFSRFDIIMRLASEPVASTKGFPGKKQPAEFAASVNICARCFV